jgi:hypothetical protein
MKTFQEFVSIIKEMKGDYGSGVKPSKPKCGSEGTTSYAMLPGKKVCKFHRKRE